jgi:methyl-accepting chemotaxis protein
VGVPPPLNRLFGVPSTVASALRVLPEIAAHTAAMVEHTAMLERIARSLERVGADTLALKELRDDMGEVAQQTATMDGRMAEIAGAMPVLVEVQQHLSRVPETLERLDVAMDRLSGQLERMLGSLDALSVSVDALQEGVSPLGRIAGRWSRRGRGNAQPGGAAETTDAAEQQK